MTKTEKIVVGSTIIIGASALAMMALTKKHDSETERVRSELSDIRYTLSKSREELIVLNRETAEGNRILRRLIDHSIDDLMDDNK